MRRLLRSVTLLRARGDRRLVLGLLCAGVFLTGLDQTVVVTALPSMMLDLHIPIARLDQAFWIVGGYLLGYTVALPLLGRVADTYGYVRVYLGSLLLFTLASVAILLAPNLTWVVVFRVVQAAGGQRVSVPLKAFRHDLQAMAERITPRTRMVFIGNPNNPTGSCIPPYEISAFVKALPEGIIVLLDEAYREYVPDALQPDTVRYAKEGRPVIALRSFSKIYGLSGLRIGYACIGTDLRQLIAFSARYLGYNQLTERIALAALDEKEYYRRITRQMREDTEEYYQTFSLLDGFTPFRSEANFILVRYPLTMKQALQADLKTRGIVVKFLDDPGLQDCIRITIGTKEQNAFVVAAFKEIVGAQTIPAHDRSLHK